MDKYSSSTLWVILNLELSRLQFVDYNSQTSTVLPFLLLSGCISFPLRPIGLDWSGLHPNASKMVTLLIQREDDCIKINQATKHVLELARLKKHRQPNDQGLAWWKQTKTTQTLILARLKVSHPTKQGLGIWNFNCLGGDEMSAWLLACLLLFQLHSLPVI